MNGIISDEELVTMEQTAKWLARESDFIKLMTCYRCAIMEVETKLRVLNAEFSLEHDRNPFEQIESRIKDPISIVEKLQRKGLPLTVASMEKEISDIAGIRVVCSFKEDIYKLATLLVQQDDIILVKEKDYIEHPKENGYRSLHLIVDIPIFLSEGKQHMKVEVQFRTIAMDFWASLEHKMKYKKTIRDAEEISIRLKECADNLASMDEEMESIRHQIDNDI